MTQAHIGETLSPEEEADVRRAHFTELADDADAAVKVIEEKLAGVKATLVAKKAEAKQLRAEARKGEK